MPFVLFSFLLLLVDSFLLLTALDAFLQEDRRCGELDGGVEGERVWLSAFLTCQNRLPGSSWLRSR